MQERKLIQTADGSFTLLLPEWNESYHSVHGAIREAVHVFIQNGLMKIKNLKEISVLEIGFGTGLNGLLSGLFAIDNPLKINYTGLEKYPLNPDEFLRMNYPESIAESLYTGDSKEDIEEIYLKMMQSEWGKPQCIHQHFMLQKIQTDFRSFDYPEATFDLVYFDAFGARVQPELWTVELFEKIHFCMKTNGLLTTYSAKGSVRRALKELGFEVHKLSGPPGKREMLNAIKK